MSHALGNTLQSLDAEYDMLMYIYIVKVMIQHFLLFDIGMVRNHLRVGFHPLVLNYGRDMESHVIIS